MAALTGDPNSHNVETFSDGMTGECLCGGIHVTIHKKGLFDTPNGVLCHCANCRKLSGSMVSSSLMVDRKDVTIDDPKNLVKIYNDGNTGSGGIARRSFCSNCGSPLYAMPTHSDKFYGLYLGIFPRIPQPAGELFTSHRHPWLPAMPGATQYKLMPTSAELEQ